MITREADYALRTVLYLSENIGKGPVSTSLAGEKLQIPYRFLRKISRELIESGIARSQRGKQGGLLLNKSPDKISLLDVIVIFDKRFVTFNLCCSDTEDCDRKPGCRVHKYFNEIQTDVLTKLSSIYFSQILSDKMP